MNEQKAYFAAGCFWGPQPAFEKIKGVISTKVGYCGGNIKNPTYQQVCTGETGHAETVEITFDGEAATYQMLLDTFWQLHDPTQLNKQGPDIGTQYRSAIFTANDEQYEAAQKSKSQWETEHFGKTATTIIEPIKEFYEAEPYHQNYICKRNKTTM